MRRLLLAATVLAPIVTFGAALGFPTGGAVAQPVTGLYIGGAGGANFLQQERPRAYTGVFNGTPVRVTSGGTGFETGYVGLGSIGYGFGNGLRLEVEGNYRYNRLGRSGSLLAGSTQGGHERKIGGMLNVLFDLDIGSGYVYPYIGGGLGYASVEQKFSATSLVPPVGTTRLSGTEGSFAYQAIAGFSFPIPPVVGLSLTAEYRYYALAGDRNYAISSPGFAPARRATSDNYNHSLMLGLRYAFNVAPPPVEAAAPAPVAQAARSYLVFFDWDRADLTDRARQIIAEAAQASTRVQTTRIEVTGHTDTSGTARYNQGLSERRAQVVAGELVRLGVPASAISTSGVGFSRPLVSTGPGVREPQNRRVEIVLR